MARKLKVFAADLGFVRAVVAAPSRKAALEAWGVRDDLFARGTAEEIDDPALVKEATASPGVVVRKPIAEASDIVGAAKRPTLAKAGSAPATTKQVRPRAPSRKALDVAEADLREEEARRDRALKSIEEERAELETRLSRVQAERDASVKTARAKRDRAKAAFDRAVKEAEA